VKAISVKRKRTTDWGGDEEGPEVGASEAGSGGWSYGAQRSGYLCHMRKGKATEEKSRQMTSKSSMDASSIVEV